MDIQHSIQTYISDMLALEEHVRVPFEAQLRDPDLQQYPGADAALRRLSDLANMHVTSLNQLLQAHGGHPAHAVKSTIAGIEGLFASAIDMVRKTKIAKALRDDYTVLSLCCVSYSMLLTTANAYSANDVAQVALRHMYDYSQAIVELGRLMPDIVIRDLQQIGAAVNPSAGDTTRKQIEEVWRPPAESRTTTGTIESDAAAHRTSSPTYPTI